MGTERTLGTAGAHQASSALSCGAVTGDGYAPCLSHVESVAKLKIRKAITGDDKGVVKNYTHTAVKGPSWVLPL
jgi:hypothetical protein